MWDRDEVDKVCEWGVITLMLGVVIYAALALGGVRLTEFAVVGALTGIALVLWTVRLWLWEGHRFLLHPVVWPLLAFVGYAGWRYSHAPVEYVARLEWMQILLYAAVFFLVLHNLHRQETLQWATAVLSVLGMCLSFYSLVQLASGSDLVWWFVKPGNYARRGGGTFINPNHLAGLLVVLFPLATTHVFLGRIRPLIRVLYGYAALVMLCGIGVTMSRGGWLATALSVALLFVWLLRRRQHRLPALLMLVVVATGAFFYFTRVDFAKWRLEGTLREGTADSGHSRQYLLQPTLKMWRDHVWTGVGPGQYDVAFPKYRPPTIQNAPVHAHNEYLELLAAYGLVGAGLFLAVLGALVWGAHKTSKFVERGSSELGFKASNRTAFFLGATLGLFGIAVHCLVEFHLHIPGVGLAVMLMAGLMASNLRFATDNFWLTPRWWSSGIATVLAVGWIAWMSPLLLRGWREGRYLNAAAANPSLDEKLISSLKSAFAVEPQNPRTAYEIGENYRLLSWQGLAGYPDQAREAITWLERSARLNPFDAHTRLRLALSRHWLEDRAGAAADFDAALRLGPNDVTIANYVGWNRMLRGDLEGARHLLEQSRTWWPWGNSMAEHYIGAIERAIQAKSGKLKSPEN